MVEPLTPFTLTNDDRVAMHQLYQQLHRSPELSMQEYQTQAFIEQQLDELGIEHFRCGGTGVVGILSSGDTGQKWPQPVVAFRADTDGLPIAEDTDLEYASTAQGTLPDGTEVPVMHGCGHDTHITSLLMAAHLLMRDRSQWSGTVVLIFQPGEETAAGARAMVDDGLWSRAPRPEVILGQHVSPDTAGTITLCRGTAMAMADSLKVTVQGQQTHGSQPENGVDPIVAASSMVTRLQTVVSREVAPSESGVVTVGTFHAGLKENIIPQEAEFTLNIRTLTPQVREKVLSAVRRIIAAEAQASGADEPVIEKLYDFPVNYNDPEASDRVLDVLQAALGEDVVHSGQPKLGSEDFGWLGESISVPTVFWWFGGAQKPGGPTNHSPQFAPVMEPTLSTGTYAALATLRSWLQ